MTAPDHAAFEPDDHVRAEGRTLRIGLEWFLNPDHLALIAARDAGHAARRGLDLALIEPLDHYDGFAALADGEVDLVVTEPLHLLEPMAAGCEAIGCLFETRGGVLIREDRLPKLRGGETVRVASPVSGAFTDRLCRRILQGWAGAQGFALAETQIVVDAAGFRHVDNLVDGWDAAWLAFANVEAVEARHRGLAVRLITAEDAGLPGFSALELVARRERRPDEAALHETLVTVLEDAAARLLADPDAAVTLWRAASKDDSAAAEAIVRATVPCLRSPLDRRPDRWACLEPLRRI